MMWKNDQTLIKISLRRERMDKNNYIEIDAIRIRQLQNSLMLIGKIKFADLKMIHRLTERKESFDDPFTNNSQRYESDEEFQRQLSRKKLNEIKEYLREELNFQEKGKSLGMFPTSLILSLPSYEIEDFKIDEKDKERIEKGVLEIDSKMILKSFSQDLKNCFYLPINSSNDRYKIYIPRNKEICLIVDGQHRFYGAKLLYDSANSDSERKSIEDFEFISTFLIGFDIYEIGQVFATVNFNQKPVNRSLYYDIFGSAPQTDRFGGIQNDIKLAHLLALHMQNNDKSPLKGMIKLLGKGYGLFSQAFFVEKMLLIFKSGIWDKLLQDYLYGGKEYKSIATFLRTYFESISESYPDCWPEKVEREDNKVYSAYAYQYILCKTTGLGAYFRLVRDIYQKYGNLDAIVLKKSLLKLFKKIQEQEAKMLFDKYGQYGGAGAEGLQEKLYKELKNRYELT
jgi:DGQHR domain-containing protein